jgi:type I restriction enzyme M protein
VCVSDMLLKGQDATHIHPGNAFTRDGEAGATFDYMLANPPFGVEWKKVEKQVRAEHDEHGMAGRFGAGLPRINDGSFLFLQHLISKMKPVEQGGSRIAIVFNGSPLFTGAAGSGESNIRRWIVENDWLDAVVALPDQLFYNTGISTYFWIVTNRKRPERCGKVQLIDARECWVKMRRSLGEKRKMLSDQQIADVTRLYADFEESDRSKVFPNAAFGFRRITVERPQKDAAGETVRDSKGRPKVDTALRDQESVPLGEDIGEYMRREVLPWVPDAWVDESKTKIGYEIPLTRHFYTYSPPRPLEEIDAEIKALEAEIVALLSDVAP